MLKRGLVSVVLVLLASVALAAPTSLRHANPITIEDASLHELIHHEVLNPHTYDLEAAKILSDAHPSVHNFLAMLEEDDDENVNLQNLVSAFIELMPASSNTEADVDDGGPESVRSVASMFKSKGSNEAITASLGRMGLKPESTTTAAAKIEESNLVGIAARSTGNDASVLAPNPVGSSFSSSVSDKFTDNTANLATLTQNVNEMSFRLNQLQMFVQRRLKCRVNPDACQETTPPRDIKPKEECNRRWKYLCRTTYELTPGASAAITDKLSAAASSSAAASLHSSVLTQQDVVTLQHGTHSLNPTAATNTQQHAKPLLGTSHDDAISGAETSADAVVLQKTIEKQMHQMEEQERLLKKAMSELQLLKQQQAQEEQQKTAGNQQQPVMLVHVGTVQDTGAHSARDHTAESAAPVLEQTASVTATATATAGIVTAADVSSSTTPAAAAAAAVVVAETVSANDNNQASQDAAADSTTTTNNNNNNNNNVVIPEIPSDVSTAPASDALATPSTEGQQQEEQQQLQQQSPQAVSESEAEKSVAAFMGENIGEIGNIQLGSSTTTTPTTNKDNKNNDLKPKSLWHQRQKEMELAKQRALSRVQQEQMQQASKEETHSRAAKWAKMMLGSRGPNKHSKVFIPDHLRDLVSLPQLSEGLGNDNNDDNINDNMVGLHHIPDTDMIRRLAASAYNAMHNNNNNNNNDITTATATARSPTMMGVESLVELEEGTGVVAFPSDDDIHRMAVAAAAAEQQQSARKCVRRDVETQACEEYDDGSRCLVTDKTQAFCGFVSANGNGKKEFKVVLVKDLLM